MGRSKNLQLLLARYYSNTPSAHDANAEYVTILSTSLFLAVSYNRSDMLNILSKVHGIDVNYQVLTREAILFVAAEAGQLGHIKLLLRIRNLNFNLSGTAYKWTPPDGGLCSKSARYSRSTSGSRCGSECPRHLREDAPRPCSFQRLLDHLENAFRPPSNWPISVPKPMLLKTLALPLCVSDETRTVVNLGTYSSGTHTTRTLRQHTN